MHLHFRSLFEHFPVERLWFKVLEISDVDLFAIPNTTVNHTSHEETSGLSKRSSVLLAIITIEAEPAERFDNAVKFFPSVYFPT